MSRSAIEFADLFCCTVKVQQFFKVANRHQVTEAPEWPASVLLWGELSPANQTLLDVLSQVHLDYHETVPLIREIVDAVNAMKDES